MLTSIGMFKEHCGGNFPSILTPEGMDIAIDERKKVAHYLASCPIAIASPGVVRDFFDASEIAGTPSLRTDGNWLWHDTYAYYVGRGLVNVKEALLSDIRARNYVPPNDAEISFAELKFPW
ncbi:hypothetical protein [Variovorax paradoxus]|uniref:hypothetical protein n=1 Tax=Variovorax paradoxus TaxID=34073 RepID=UPI00339250AB